MDHCILEIVLLKRDYSVNSFFFNGLFCSGNCFFYFKWAVLVWKVEKKMVWRFLIEWTILIWNELFFTNMNDIHMFECYTVIASHCQTLTLKQKLKKSVAHVPSLCSMATWQTYETIWWPNLQSASF